MSKGARWPCVKMPSIITRDYVIARPSPSNITAIAVDPAYALFKKASVTSWYSFCAQYHICTKFDLDKVLLRYSIYYSLCTKSLFATRSFEVSSEQIVTDVCMYTFTSYWYHYCHWFLLTFCIQLLYYTLTFYK